jgi:hypothetical protein
LANQKSKAISLSEWINEKGVETVAGLLGVDPSTVRHWRRGHCYPRVDQMREIKRLSKGLVGYDEIIDGASTTNSSAGAR